METPGDKDVTVTGRSHMKWTTKLISNSFDLHLNCMYIEKWFIIYKVYWKILIKSTDLQKLQVVLIWCTLFAGLVKMCGFCVNKSDNF